MSQYTPEQIAEFILKYAENQEVKGHLKKKGFNIVPNSLSKLIENLEKAGFKVIKKEEFDRLSQSAVTPAETQPTVEVTTVEQPIQTVSNLKDYQLFGAKPDPNVESKEEKKVLTDPFGGSGLTETSVNTGSNPATSTGSTHSEGNQSSLPKKDENQTFNHKSEPLKEPNEPFENLWFNILQKAKEHSIAFYSLLVNAQPVKMENQTFEVGFTSKHTYQMNQFKRGDNLTKFKEILIGLTNQTFEVETSIVEEKKQSQTTQPKNQTKDYQLFGGKA